jgi:PPOX class probable F420-dependent enzyme
MTEIPESHRDLLTGNVVLATIGPGGRPQVTAVSAVLDDDGVLATSLNNSRQKYRNLVGDARATVFAVDPADPMRTIEVRADVEIVDDPDKSFARHLTKTLGFDFDVDDIDQPGDRRVKLVFHPTKVNANDPSAYAAS